MGDLECGFEEMQGVRLGYLLIQGKQMFALSQVFTELLKNIPRTTVHKRMDHLNVKKHHCDLDELRKLKAINSIAFHAAKCTLISREDVEALYVSCKTERVLKSGSHKRKAASCEPTDRLASTELLRADAELWQEKVWLSLHGVHEKAARGRREASCDSKLPHFYHKTHGREYRSAAKSTHRHFKNYETAKLQGNRMTFSQRHSFFRSAPAAALQSTMAAHSRLSRTAGDLQHKRKRRREGGGGRDGVRHPWKSRHHHHVPPVVLVQPKSSITHRTAFGAFQLSPNFYLHNHHLQPSFPDSSDTESSTYSDRAYPDSDFGSGFSTSSSSDEEEEEDDDEDDTQSDSTEVSSDEEEESSSHSDSSSVSSRVSVQSIRFRRARVAKTLNPIKAPVVLQPTFHYNNQQQHGGSLLQDHAASTQEKPWEFNNHSTGSIPKFHSVLFTETKWDRSNRTLDEHLDTKHASSSTLVCPINEHKDDTVRRYCSDEREVRSPGLKLQKIKTEAEEPSVTASPALESGCKVAMTPPLGLHKVKLKVEESCDEYERQSQPAAVRCKEAPCSSDASVEGRTCTESNLGESPASQGRLDCRALGRKSKLSRAQSKHARVTRTASSSSSSCGSQPCEDPSMEDLPSRRKRIGAMPAAWTQKPPFSLMANFPFSASLVVGSDGDLSPAYSLNSLRAAGPPPPSHPVWRWQPGGHILPPPHAQRTSRY
ncbi:SKI/DACH domain-containing protein 1 [Nerophis ophidion]|uniref:SKI/DACH domain-containing protein 1 n=1 Tax=Nerophis ophidion TaxID=159077 RepID=UPI002AE001B7|nr:SKI/DACH domain-containing protein 1 [Nerophis ophidion]